uniref:Uncharacterized protein n=1 Tax=Plectus sambesii TaxID=2011161 RepID=A0A914UR03_9BILA
MSLLLNLEGALNDDPKAPWDQVKAADPASYALIVLDFLHLLFKVLTISMRFEPANAKQFFSEVRYDSLTVSLKLTGAFEDVETIEAKADTRQVTLESCRDWLTACHRVFQVHLDDRVIPTDIPHRMLYVCYILRLLFNMALDNYEKPSGDLSKCSASEEISPLINGNHNRTLFPNAPDSIIVHPGAVMCILDLLPAIVVSGNDDPVWALVVQLYAAEVLKSLVRSERNQQVMCDAGLPRRLFVVGNSLLKTDVHLLLPPFYYILERLSNNSMQPRELRYFLRLDKPLCCRNLEERPGEEPMVENEGGPVPLTRVKALVSMMTPRDYRVGAAPPFIEFDMSVEGF